MKLQYSLYIGVILMIFFNNLIAVNARMDQVNRYNRQGEIFPNLRNADNGSSRVDVEQAPEIIPGGDEDLGTQLIIRKKHIRRWWDVTLGSSAIYVSNMLLQSDRYAVDTTLLVSTVQLHLAPDPIDINGNKLYLGCGFIHNWFNYGLGDNGSMFRYQGDISQDDLGGYNEFDFDSQTIQLGLNYLINDSWGVKLGFKYTRLLGHEISHVFPQTSNYSETYKEYAPSWGCYKFFNFSPTMSLNVGYTGTLYYTDSENPNPEDQIDGTNRRDINNRLESSLSLNLRQQIVPTVFASPFFFFKYSNYNMNENRNDLSYKNREDFTYTYGSAFSWDITEWFTLSTYGSWEKRKSSSNRVAEYAKYDLGGGFSATVRF